jgi:hypothetical protein
MFQGVQQDGLVEIPWSLGAEKDAVNGFARTLAAAIPGAVVYETPKFWVVSKAAKQRVNVLELLDATAALRLAARSPSVPGPGRLACSLEQVVR